MTRESTQYQEEIELNLPEGLLEVCLAEFNVDYEYYLQDTRSGGLARALEVDAELTSVTIGGLALNRCQIQEMVGDDELKEIEEVVAQKFYENEKAA